MNDQAEPAVHEDDDREERDEGRAEDVGAPAQARAELAVDEVEARVGALPEHPGRAEERHPGELEARRAPRSSGWAG